MTKGMFTDVTGWWQRGGWFQPVLKVPGAREASNEFASDPLGNLKRLFAGDELRGTLISPERSVPSVSVISYEQLSPAITRSVESYLSTQLATGPLQLTFEISPLDDQTLGLDSINYFTRDGQVRSATIRLDQDAAGVGWFVGDDVHDKADFSQTLDETAFLATEGSAAFGKYDLFTVLLHELGHVFGFSAENPRFSSRVQTLDGAKIFVGDGVTVHLTTDGDHVDDPNHPNDLMSELLAPGVRRLPSQLDVQVLHALWEHTHQDQSRLSVEDVLPETAGGTGTAGAAAAVLNPAPAGIDTTPGAVDRALLAVASLFAGAPGAGAIPNGAFDVAASDDPGFAWRARGSATVQNGRGLLLEDARLTSGLNQTFVVPTGATALAFDLVAASFDAPGNGPLDAFEVALLDAGTLAPVAGIIGLTHADALLNVQASGRIYKSSHVTVRGLTGDTLPANVTSPITVMIDVTDVDAGRVLTLYFDLLGFGATGSSVVIDNVRFLAGAENTAPVANDDPFTLAEDTPAVLDVLANDTDAEGDPLTTMLVDGPSHGAVAHNADGSFTYTPATNYNGSDTFTYTVNDGQADSNVATVSLSVTSVNDAPRGANKTVATREDTAYTFAAADFGFSDPNDSPADAFQALKVTSLPTAGTLAIAGSPALAAGDVVAVADIAGGKLQLIPAPNANGAGYATFTFQVQDDGGTANGGVDLDPTPRTLTIDVTAVNDAPQGASKTVTTLEDTAYTFGAADFGFSDPNDSPANNFLAVKIVTLPAAGILTDNGVAVATGAFVPVTDLAAGHLLFAPAPNANGPGYATLTFQVQDSGGTADGGVNLDPTPRTLTIDVTAVNDAPQGTSKTVTTLEDSAYTFSAADFGFSDPNDTPPNSLRAVKISSLPTAGALAIGGGAALNAGDFVAVSDIAAGKLRFTPAPNANG